MTKRKGNNYMFWHSPIALLILFCFFILFAYNIIGLIEKAKETAYKKELTIEKINSLEKKEKSLSNSISNINTEEGQEEIIREKYQVAKSGEKMLIIIDDDRVNLKTDKENNKRSSFSNWLGNIFKE
jgi:hypothetical protein